MSFKNAYTNLAILDTLTANIVASNSWTLSDASSLKIDGGESTQAIVRSNVPGQVTWADRPSGNQTIAGNIGAVYYRQFSTSTITSSPNLTFDNVSNTLTVSQIATNAVINISAGANLGNIGNILVPGANVGDILVSDGQGNSVWTSPSTASSITVVNYAYDINATTVFPLANGQIFVTVQMPTERAAGVIVNSSIAFSNWTPGSTVRTYRIAAISSVTPVNETTSRVAMTLASGIVTSTTIPAGTRCFLREAIDINRIVTNDSIVKYDIRDEVLYLSVPVESSGTNGQILLNNSGQPQYSTTVKYYDVAPGPGYKSNQLVANNISVNSLSVSSQLEILAHSDNVTSSINFSNSSSPGTFATTFTGGATALNARSINVQNTMTSGAYLKNSIKYGEWVKWTTGTVSRSVGPPTVWTYINFDGVLANGTGLTYSQPGGTNSRWTNNTGNTITVIISYTVSWSNKGSFDDSYGDGWGKHRATGIVVNRVENNIYGIICNRGMHAVNPTWSNTAALTLANGDYFELAAAQNADTTPLVLGTTDLVPQTWGARITITVL